jgi:hypothetical protein
LNPAEKSCGQAGSTRVSRTIIVAKPVDSLEVSAAVVGPGSARY